MKPLTLAVPLLCFLSGLFAGAATKVAEKKEATPAYYHVDPATAGAIKGAIHFTGKKPARQLIDMSNEPACVQAHPARPTKNRW